MNQNFPITQRNVGVNYIVDQAQVCVWAPHTDQVALVLSDDRKLVMAKDDFGFWHLDTHLLTTDSAYAFELTSDGKSILRADPASLSQNNGVHEWSQSFDLKGFVFQDQNWKGIPLSKTILYELHVGTFTPEGSLETIIGKLDYLLELGINTIELMPVNAFPGTRNWGYDGVYPFAVQQKYGGALALQQLVNACHLKGIAVILDVVYNHIGPEGNYLNDFGPYFNQGYHTAWGPALNFDGPESPAVRSFFLENALMWLRDFHIDGLRLDAIHAIRDFSAKPLLQELRYHVDRLGQEMGRTYHLIIECDLNDPKYLMPLALNGQGMDAHWNDDFHHSLRVSIGEPKNGYYAAYKGLEDLAKSMVNAYVYDGKYSPTRKMYIGDDPIDLESKQLIVFTQNHDQVGNRINGERTAELYGYEAQKLMAGTVFLSPFVPQLFMGEEWASPTPFQYFVDHSDPELIEKVRQGRQAEFSHEGNAPDPFSESTFRDSKLKWQVLPLDKHQEMFRFYQALIRFRKANPLFRHVDRKDYQVEINDQKNTLTLNFGQSSIRFFAILNFSKEEHIFELPSQKAWYLQLDSASSAFGGPHIESTAQDTPIVKPQSFQIFTANHV